MAEAIVVSVNLFCHQLDRIFEFYHHLFTLEEIEEHRSPIYRALRIGDSDLGFHAPPAVQLLNAAALRPNAPAVSHYPTFHVTSREQVDVFSSKAIALGGTVLKPPYLTYYNAWQAVLQDPEGNLFRINHYLAPDSDPLSQQE